MYSDQLNNIINVVMLAYILVPFAFVIYAIIARLLGQSFSSETIDKAVEILKWYLASVALVLIAKTIESSYTERETGIKEMQVYDKYAQTILEADNIEKRWKLAEYFSTVTPTERLRTRWINYKEVIQEDYNLFLELKQKEKKLLAKVTGNDTLSYLEIDSLVDIQQMLAPLESKLLQEDNKKWVVIFTSDKTLDQAEYESNNLMKAGIEGAMLVYRSGAYRNVSTPFSSRTDAQQYLNKNKSVLRNDIYIVNFDSWCKNLEYNGKYYTCD